MSQLEGTENRINIAHRDYNEAVQGYNTTIRTFPTVIGARIIYGAQPMVPFRRPRRAPSVAPTVDFGNDAVDAGRTAAAAPRRSSALVALLLRPRPAAAQSFPALTGRVVDQANLLDPSRRRR